MKRNKLLLLLVLLLTAATGAWATDVDVYVVGNGSDGNWLNGVAWDPGAAGNKMTEQNGVYSITFKDVDANSDLQFKFAINGSWNENFGCTSWDANELNKTLSNIEAGGANFKFGLTEKADVTISFNLSELTYMISTKGMKVGDDAATGYTVSLKDGVKDADKWTVKVGEGQAQALPIGGLKGDGKETVTLQYTGRLKVKGVKATSEAAAPSVPDGAINGKFSVSDGKQVYFSKGNLRYASSKWSFFDNQYDYYTSYSADAWDHFGWSTSATDYGKNTSTIKSDYSGDFVDWGATMGTGWRMLTSDEWTYLLKTRSASTVGGTENGRYAKAKVNNVRGVILFPDTYTHPDGVNAPTGVNATGDTGWNGNSYTAEDWTKMETAGCVFLPAAGYRNGSMVNNPGSVGDYSSATPSGTEKAYELYFSSGSLNTASEGSRFYGLSVRLVQEVTSDAAAPAAPTYNETKSINDGPVTVAAGEHWLITGTGTQTSNAILIAAGATVTLDGVNISSGDYCIKCLGDATIILKDGSTNTLYSSSQDYPALSIGDANTTLTIQGSTGVLNVSSGMFCAGIGGGYSNTNSTCGNIRIEGGVITAKGGSNGAGIGTDCGEATCGDIIITGGTITAKGGDNAAGIGTGNRGEGQVVCGNITIANTVTKVTATKGEFASHSIGKGDSGNCTIGTVTIGGTKYWENNAAVNGGDTYLATSPLIYDPSN